MTLYDRSFVAAPLPQSHQLLRSLGWIHRDFERIKKKKQSHYELLSSKSFEKSTFRHVYLNTASNKKYDCDVTCTERSLVVLLNLLDGKIFFCILDHWSID